MDTRNLRHPGYLAVSIVTTIVQYIVYTWAVQHCWTYIIGDEYHISANIVLDLGVGYIHNAITGKQEQAKRYAL